MANFKQLSLYELENQQLTITDLTSQINEKRKEVKTHELSMSISELANMYKRGHLDIHPEFQRLFRWSDVQKSRFIESILLDIPIPPIFVAEDANAAWDVIDGVQRLSTIFEFMGILEDEHGKILDPSVLVATKKLPALEGKVWDNKFHKYNFSFEEGPVLQNKFLYSAFKIIKVSNDSDPDAKYDIFDRLNTGGSKLTHQEIRNCLAIMMNRSFYTWMRELSCEEYFVNCMPLSEKLQSEQADLEYILRFIVYRNVRKEEYSNSREIHDLLTTKMKDFCVDNSINLDKEKEIFMKTFKLLNDTFGENTFKRYYSSEGKFKGAVLLSSYEIIAIGISNNIDEILQLPSPVSFIQDRIINLYDNEQYTALQDQKIVSQRAVTRFKTLTEFGTRYFNPLVNT